MINDTSCCAMKEIGELDYSGRGTYGAGKFSAERAMKNFCKQTFADRYGGYKPSAFYIFSAHVGYVDTSDMSLTYGPEFAALIKKHKLGDLSESTPHNNRRVHPDHLVQVWIWCPDEERLKAWYKKATERKKVQRVRSKSVKAKTV